MQQFSEQLQFNLQLERLIPVEEACLGPPTAHRRLGELGDFLSEDGGTAHVIVKSFLVADSLR
jgi:hypothetical protein